MGEINFLCGIKNLIVGGFKLLKAKSTVSKWFISYAILFLVPLLIFGITYSYIEDSLENEIKHSNQLMLTIFQKGLDDILSSNMRIVSELSLNSNVIKLMTSKKSSDLSQHIIANEISKYMKALSISNQLIDNQFLYIYDLDMGIMPSGVTDGQNIYNMFYKNVLTFDEWKNMSHNTFKGNHMILNIDEADQSAKTIALMNSIPLSDNSPKAVVVAIISWENFNPQNFYSQDMAVSDIYILDTNNNMLIGENDYNDLDFSKLTDKSGVLINGENVVSYTSSTLNGWKIIISTPKNTFWSEVIYTRTLISVFAILSIALGTVLTLFLVKRNYSPMKNLVDQIKSVQKTPANNTQSEYSFILESITSTLQENSDIKLEFEKQQSSMVQNILYKLLKGQVRSTELETLSSNSFNMRFTSDKFLLALFSVKNLESLFEAEQDLSLDQKYDLCQLIVTNVMEEWINEKHSGYCIDVDGYFAVVVAASPKYMSSFENDVRIAAEKGLEFFNKHFNLSFCVAISTINNKLSGLQKCYETAYNTMTYMRLFNFDGILLYTNINSHDHLKYYYPLDKEIQLTNFIKTANIKATKELIDEVLTTNFDGTVPKNEFVKILVLDLASTFLKTIENEDVALVDIDWFKEIFYCDDMAKIRTVLFNIAEELCSYYSNKLEYKPRSLSADIKDYIQDNYDKQDFGVADIGNEFGLNSSYISKLFKEETGDTLVNCIAKVRIEKAKELIAETNYTFDEIAHLVGYLDSRALGRAFKRIEGILPSRYKELVKYDGN